MCVVNGTFSVSCFGLLSRIVLMLHRCLVAKGKLWGRKFMWRIREEPITFV
jgi:hypothetical protein